MPQNPVNHAGKARFVIGCRLGEGIWGIPGLHSYMETESVADLDWTLCYLERQVIDAEEQGNGFLAADCALKADQIRRRLQEALREREG